MEGLNDFPLAMTARVTQIHLRRPFPFAVPFQAATGAFPCLTPSGMPQDERQPRPFTKTCQEEFLQKNFGGRAIRQGVLACVKGVLDD